MREGPDALTNRRVAREAGVTTMAIYSRFGGKGGVLDALYVELSGYAVALIDPVSAYDAAVQRLLSTPSTSSPGRRA